jgi:hypothetical protein
MNNETQKQKPSSNSHMMQINCICSYFLRIHIAKGAQVQAEEYRRSSADQRRQGLAQGSNE